MDRRFKDIERIDEVKASTLVSLDEDNRNTDICFYTLNPSLDPKYPAEDGWEDVTYYTKRNNTPPPNDGDKEAEEVVYVLSNPTMPGLYKIGMTGRDVEVRMRELSKASGIALPFKLEYFYRTNLALKMEKEIHNKLRDYSINKQKEFFRIDLDEAIKAVKEVGKFY